MICHLVRTDGRRECIDRALVSFEEKVTAPVTRRIIHDDSGDVAYTEWLRYRFPDYEVITTYGRSGFAGAIQSAWRVLEHVDEPLVFDCEDDFVFSGSIDLVELAARLELSPYLAQIALKRQPWGTEPEGGFMAQAPQWYFEQRDGESAWVETRRNWTTNNSLYRREIVHLGWPDAPDSEGYFGFAVKEDFGLPWGIQPGFVQFGIWGAIDDPPLIEHIGRERVGHGY